MYEKKDKRRLYWLIDEYLSGRIDEPSFCDEFYYCYDLEIEKKSLNEVERRAFDELNEVSSRFSQYEIDHKTDPRAFSDAKELKQKITATKRELEKKY